MATTTYHLNPKMARVRAAGVSSKYLKLVYQMLLAPQITTEMKGLESLGKSYREHEAQVGDPVCVF